MKDKLQEDRYKLLREIFVSASEGIILTDKAGKIQFANPRAESIFKFGSDELLNKQVEVLLPDKLKDQHHAHRKNYIEAPKARPMGQGMDLVGRCKDGSSVPIEISLSSFTFEEKFYAIAFIIDITKRKKQEEEIDESRNKLKMYAQTLEDRVKQRTRELEHLNLGLQSQVHERQLAEQALKESQKLYQAIAKNFPNGIINVLDSDLNYIFVDGSLKHRLPNDKEAVIGKSYLNHFPSKKLKTEVHDYLRSPIQESHPIEVTINDKHYRIRATMISESQYLVVEEDITSAKKVEQEIIRSLEQERQLNELKSRFVSMASHEFRTPLSTIQSSASLISRYQESEQQPKREKHVNKITSSVNNLTGILNNFLSIEKVERGAVELNKQEADLRQIIEETADELEGTLKTGQKLDLDISSSIGIIFSDPRLLKNILINLLSNASKYSDDNKKIELKAEKEASDILIKVIDQGIGIPKEEQKNLFQPFYRAENVTNIQGTGLGLNIVRKYVELLDGSINFESQEGKGTTFTITLPLD